MKITINDISYSVPASLLEITLQQRIDFDIKYGKALRAMLKKISELKSDVEKEIEFTDYHMQLACKTLSFFAGIPLDIVENTNINQVLAVYHNTMKWYSEDVNFADKDWKIQHSIDWNGCTWNIAPPTLSEESEMTFGEFLTAKQAIKKLIELGDNKYEALHELCCVYFRKEGEIYVPEFSSPGKERYELMKQLPLQHALQVGFFLSNSLGSWLSSFRYSNHQEVVLPALN